jgi:hypothetical protein
MLHMTNDANKYKVLKEMAERATQKQPDEIHLIAAPDHDWSDPMTIDRYAGHLQDLGFEEAGTYTVDALPVCLQFLLKTSEQMYAVIYEHPKAGIWINLIVLFQDGTSITFTNTQDRGMERRPGHAIIHTQGATADQLYKVASAQCPGQPRKALTQESLVPEFEKAWADGIQWRKSRGGISVTEVASVILSRGGQPARVLRPDRIHYVAQQDGKPERELKDALAVVFQSYPGVSKAYLVLVKYDESPGTAVALCLLLTTKEMKLVEDVRAAFKTRFRAGEHLDIMFIAPSEAARIEAVCLPFFNRSRSPESGAFS